MNAKLNEALGLLHDVAPKVDTIITELEAADARADALEKKLDDVVGGEGDDAALDEIRTTLTDLKTHITTAIGTAKGTDDNSGGPAATT